jgi:micrococcal nuclease
LYKIKRVYILLIGCLIYSAFPVLSPAASEKAFTAPDESLVLGEKYPAELVRCVDGDTAYIKINGQTYKVRFLYIDTPESTNETEPFGMEASVFTCSYLKSGALTIETDGSTLFDKYNRLLAWVWVDDKLLQEEVTRAGLVEDFYDYDDYLYEDQIIEAMADAKKLSKGMYADIETPGSTEGLNEQTDTEDNAASVPAEPSLAEEVLKNEELKKKIEEVSQHEEMDKDQAVSPSGIFIWLVFIGLSIFIFRRKVSKR